MAKNTGFDLNECVLAWRADLSRLESFSSEQMDELEGHLRDAVPLLQAKGLSEEEAYFIASRRLGHPHELEREYAKTNLKVLWQRRAFWVVLGVLLFPVCMSLSSFGAYLALFVGSQLALGGFTLGWIWLGANSCILAGLALLIRRCLGSWSELFRRRLGENWQTSTLLLLALLALGITAFSAPGLLIRLLPNAAVGEAFALLGWGTTVRNVLTVCILALVLTKLARASLGTGLASLAALSLTLAAYPVGAETVSNRALADKTDRTALEKAMALWTEGNKGGVAVEQFLKIDWAKEAPFSKGSPLAYSEAEFIALPAVAREKLSQQMQADLRTLKELARAVKETGQKYKSEGNDAKAQQCLKQINQCGERLDKSDKTLLVQMVGRAFKKLVKE